MSDKPSQEEFDAWTNDPANWRLKFFYFNPKDKRILPPKRNRYLGWTINFANPLSILAFFGLMLIVIAILRWVR